MPLSPRTEDGDDTRGEVEGLLLGGLVLAVSAVLGYGWMCARLLGIDEYLSFYTDKQATMAKVLAVQLHYPISLDPPTYHLLSHLAMTWMGATPNALRMPALLGFLIFQASVFFFVRRLAGWRAAVVAMALPLLTVSFFYAVQGRPYGLLLGMYAMSLACWQGAARETGRWRVALLAGLASALAVGITCHYFGVLILVPVCAGELARTFERRRVDWGVLTAIGIGMASVLSVIPFQRTVLMYRVHYYSTSVSWHILPQSYAALFVGYHTLRVWQQHLFLVFILLVAVVLAVMVCLRIRKGKHDEPVHEWVAVAALGLLPFFGYGLGKVVTHTMDERYVLGALAAVAIVVSVVAEPLLRRRAVFYLVFGLVCLGGVRKVYGYIQESRGGSAGQLTRFRLSPEVAAELKQNPEKRIYMQSLGDFYFNSYYEPDPALRARFSLVYAAGPEIRWLGHDTNAITAENMRHFTTLSITPYRDVLAESKPLILNYRDGWDWLGKDLDSRGFAMTDFGKALDGELVQLDIHPAMGTAGRH